MSAFFPVVSGVSAIDRIVNQPFTLGVTAATPGDLSVVIGSQTCRYDKLFEFVEVSIVIQFTPTYTTAAGNLILTGLPFAADADSPVNLIPMGQTTAFTWPSTATQMFLAPIASTNTGFVLGTKSGGSGAGTAITAFTTATAYTLRFRGRYRTARV